MFLPDSAIHEYMQIYKNHFDEEISFEEAREQGEQLIQLMKLVYEPNDSRLNDNRQNYNLKKI